MVIHLGRNLKGSRGTRGLHFHHFAINRAQFQRGHDVVADRNDRHRSGDHGSLHLQGYELSLSDNVQQEGYQNDHPILLRLHPTRFRDHTFHLDSRQVSFKFLTKLLP